MIGQVVDGLEILRPLGIGGMGEVYLARSTGGTLRALKIVRTDRDASLQAIARFRREVLALSKLRHSGIVQIVDAGRLEGGGLYLTMEYVVGPDLQRSVGADGPFAPAEGIEVLAQIASALAFAHRAGIVHRDLKPTNVILADGERAKIIDFGLAKIMADENLTRLTDDQDILGSPMYWAPEQSSTAAVGPPADVYALGGIAFVVLTGEPMFRPRPAVAMVYAHVHEAPPSLVSRCKDVELPSGLSELVGECVAKDPAMRPTAEHVVSELERLLAVTPRGQQRQRGQWLFTVTGLTNLEQAVATQIRHVLLDLAGVLDRATDDIDRLQNELAEREMDLALVDPQSDPRRTTLAAAVIELQGAIADAFRELFDAVNTRRGHASAEAHELFAELDDLVERYREKELR